jgi:hypothetical protein
LVSVLIVKIPDIIGNDVIPPRVWGQTAWNEREKGKKKKNQAAAVAGSKGNSRKLLPHRSLIREETRIFFIRSSSTGSTRALAGSLLRAGTRVGA